MEFTALADTMRAEKAMAEHPMYPSRTLAVRGQQSQRRVGLKTTSKILQPRSAPSRIRTCDLLLRREARARREHARTRGVG
jgi:hypothetical protein